MARVNHQFRSDFLTSRPPHFLFVYFLAVVPFIAWVDHCCFSSCLRLPVADDFGATCKRKSNREQEWVSSFCLFRYILQVEVVA